MSDHLVGINQGKVTIVDPSDGSESSVGSTSGLSYFLNGEAAIGNIFYFSNPDGFFKINLQTGEESQISSDQYVFVADVQTGALAGFRNGNPGQILKIDPKSGNSTPIAQIDGLQGVAAGGIAATNGNLYFSGVDQTGASRIYTVDLTDGMVNSVASTATNFVADDSSGLLIGIQGQNIEKIDPTTGESIEISHISALNGYYVGGEAAENGHFFLDAPAGSGSTTLYTVDVADGSVSEVSSNTQNLNPLQDLTMCFRSGTRLNTLSGYKCIEELEVGDLLLTYSGDIRPAIWIGKKIMQRDRDSKMANDFMPIRIAAHAFGVGLPMRDLFLSPGHPVLIASSEPGDAGHLVPIMCLVNGTTIDRVEVETVTYWHVELDAHDILLAEGLPAESYIDLGTRPWFSGESSAIFDPDIALAGMTGRCRKIATDGPVVEAERHRLDALFSKRLEAAAAWPSAEVAPYF